MENKNNNINLIIVAAVVGLAGFSIGYLIGNNQQKKETIQTYSLH